MTIEVVPYKKQKPNTKVQSCLNGKTVTKRIKILSVSANSDKKKFVLSNVEIEAAGFEVGSTYASESVDSALLLTPSDSGNKVSYRTYKNRKDYIEPVIDIRHQEKLISAIGDAEYVLVTISQNLIKIEPDANHANEAKASSRGIEFAMGNKNKKGVYDGILQLLSLVKKHKFLQVDVKAEDSFKDTSEFKLLKVQLKRLGYDISMTPDGLIRASANSNKSPDFTAQIQHTRPAHGDIIKHRDKVNDTFATSEYLSTLTLCSSGVDMMLLEQDGFMPTHLVETRPHESRDFVKKRDPFTNEILKDELGDSLPLLDELSGEPVLDGWDKSVSGVFSAAHNVSALNTIFNEDIYTFDFQQRKSLMTSFQHIHCAILCDDFASQKNKKDRERALKNLSTSADMFIPALDIFQQALAPTISIENVQGFANSTECKLLETGLENLGYTVSKAVLFAPDFGGYTSRKRTYIFATTLTDTPFSFPVAQEREQHVWHDVIKNNLHHFKRVKSKATIAEAIKANRDRFYTPDKPIFPTIVKSNMRYTKDTAYLALDDEYYIPDATMSKMLMGVNDFDLSLIENEALNVEIVGQSVDAPMHSAFLKQIKKHIDDYIHGVKAVTQKIIEKVAPPVFEQMSLF